MAATVARLAPNELPFCLLRHAAIALYAAKAINFST
jgi:hypothetical protein